MQLVAEGIYKKILRPIDALIESVDSRPSEINIYLILCAIIIILFFKTYKVRALEQPGKSFDGGMRKLATTSDMRSEVSHGGRGGYATFEARKSLLLAIPPRAVIQRLDACAWLKSETALA